MQHSWITQYLYLFIYIYTYKNVLYRLQFWNNFHEIHMVSAGPLKGEPHLVQQNNRYGKMCPQNQFFGFKSDRPGFSKETT